jgi:hypothetical protein
MEAINDRRTIWWGLCKRQMDLRSWPLEDVVAVARKKLSQSATRPSKRRCWAQTLSLLKYAYCPVMIVH